jgi:hypothetical protein
MITTTAERIIIRPFGSVTPLSLSLSLSLTHSLSLSLSLTHSHSLSLSLTLSLPLPEVVGSKVSLSARMCAYHRNPRSCARSGMFEKRENFLSAGLHPILRSEERFWRPLKKMSLWSKLRVGVYTNTAFFYMTSYKKIPYTSYTNNAVYMSISNNVIRIYEEIICIWRIKYGYIRPYTFIYDHIRLYTKKDGQMLTKWRPKY